MYAIADKLDVPNLKRLALEQFEKALRLDSWPYHDFPVVIAQILQSTPVSDKGLRLAAAKVCSEHMLDLLGNTSAENPIGEDWKSVLKEDSDFFFDVTQLAARSQVSRNKERDILEKDLQTKKNILLSKEKDMKIALTERTARVVQLKAESEKSVNDLTEITNIFSDTLTGIHVLLDDRNRNPCNNCKSLMMPRISKRPSAQGFNIVCRRCANTSEVSLQSLKKKVLECFQKVGPVEEPESKAKVP